VALMYRAPPGWRQGAGLSLKLIAEACARAGPHPHRPRARWPASPRWPTGCASGCRRWR
jgi:hypothetical protein